MSDTPERFADDPDAHVVYPVTNAAGDLDFTDPLVAIGSGDYVVLATWETPQAAERDLKVPLVDLDPALHDRISTLYLQVPDGLDVELGSVFIRTRQ